MIKKGFQSNNYNPDNDRKNTITSILLKTEARSEDDLVYLDNYLVKYFSQGVVDIKAKLEQTQWKQLLQEMKYSVFNNDFIFKGKQVPETDLYFVLSGKLELSGKSIKDQNEAKIESFDAFKTVVLKESLGKSLSGCSLFSPVVSEILTIDRRTFQSFMKEENTVMKQQRLKVLEKNFSKLKKAENKDDLLQHFKPKEYSQGYIITTTTSGSTDLFVISKGRVMIFLPNPNRFIPGYPRSFLILTILEKGSTFNENFVLFDKDGNFGSMVVEEQSEILSIEKTNLSLVTDEDSLNSLRANFQAKERLFKTVLDKFTGFSIDDVLKQQDDLCTHYKLIMKEIEDMMAKSTSSGKILTTSAIKDKEKNLEKFNQTFNKPVDLSNCNANMPGTNRLAPAKMNGFTREQVLAMNSLKKYAGSTSNAPASNNAEKKDNDINSIKNRLLNEEKKNVEGGLSKLSIGEKKNLNKILLEPEERKAQERGINLSKFQKSNDELLKKLNLPSEAIKEKVKDKDESSNGSNAVKIMKKLPSNDKNVVEIDNTRINLLLMEHKK